MNPLNDLPPPTSDDDTPSAPEPTPLCYFNPFMAGQLERPQLDRLTDQSDQTDQSVLYNPYADVVLSSSVSNHNENTDQPAMSERVNINENRFLSADHKDQSDTSNSHQLSITVQLGAEEELTNPDLECSICFSQFNNAFRCPKMLLCGHTFCLECLARMNVNSLDPNELQCPLCRALTPLPEMGLPKLNTDPQVISRLPSSMQRIHSIRFMRNEGRLQLKRPDAGTRTQSTRRSLDVGLPTLGRSRQARLGSRGEVDRVMFRLSERPACRAFLFTAILLMIALLVTVIVVLLVNDKEP